MSKEIQKKRKKEKRGGFRALHAKIGKRKQRVAAAATMDGELSADVPSVGVGRALMVILLLHVVAIAAILIGTRGSDDNEGSAAPALALNEEKKEESPKAVRKTIPEHRAAVLELPPVQHERAVESAPVTDRPDLGIANPVAVDEQPVRAIPVEEESPRALLVKPRRRPAVSTNYRTHEVKSGESIWRISNKYGVKQDALLKLNNLKDPRKMRTGMVLKIPHN